MNDTLETVGSEVSEVDTTREDKDVQGGQGRKKRLASKSFMLSPGSINIVKRKKNKF